MRSLAFSILAIVLTLLAGLMKSSHAADFVTYTDKTDFLAAVSNAGTDTFDDLPSFGTIPSPLNRAAGSYSYTATVPFGFKAAGSPADLWLTTQLATDPIDFTMTSGSPTAMGGFFFVTNISGNLTNATVNVSINGGQFLQSITTNSATNFFGWVSTNGTPITSFQVSASGLWPTVNDLVLAQAVPEPSTYALGALAAFVLCVVSRS